MVETSNRISEVRGRHLAQLSLFAWHDEECHSLLQTCFGVGLPGAVRSQTSSNHAKILKVSPRVCWIDANAAAPIAQLTRALPPAAGAVTDLSHSRVRVALEGPKVRTLLAKGIALDLHPAVFRVGDFALTALHHTTVLLERSGEDRYELAWLRTYSATLWEWLNDAARPLGFDLNGEVG